MEKRSGAGDECGDSHIGQVGERGTRLCTVQQTRWWPTLTAGATKAQDSKSHSNCMVSLGSSVQENTLVLLLRLIVEKKIESRMVYRTTPFSMTLNDRTHKCQGHAIFNAEYLINGASSEIHR